MTATIDFQDSPLATPGNGLIRNVCVYCGSGQGTTPIHVEAAAAFGRVLAGAGIGLVYGGGNTGLMGAVARAVLAEGGHVTGIIPQFLSDREVALEA
ncbi:MAG TPA: hypothetical protein VGB93_05735, partial [Methylovirgula sp.]